MLSLKRGRYGIPVLEGYRAGTGESVCVHEDVRTPFRERYLTYMVFKHLRFMIAYDLKIFKYNLVPF